MVSLLSLHWVNDLPGTLMQIRRALKPDGLLLAAMFGGETLKELRHALGEAEIADEGGLSPRISPFADVRDIGNLLQRAGFALPVVDIETLTVSYADPLRLLADLRGMGESNAVLERRKTLSRRRRCSTRPQPLSGSCTASRRPGPGDLPGDLPDRLGARAVAAAAVAAGQRRRPGWPMLLGPRRSRPANAPRREHDAA